VGLPPFGAVGCFYGVLEFLTVLWVGERAWKSYFGSIVVEVLLSGSGLTTRLCVTHRGSGRRDLVAPCVVALARGICAWTMGPLWG